MEEEGPRRLSRRAVLRGGGLLGLAVFVPVLRSGPGSGAVAVAQGAEGEGFLTDAELTTLRALVDRFVPGQPEDLAPGAVVAGCAEAIDALLAAFAVDPPRIYAGAPFSDRAGSDVNHFAEFLPLDPYEQRAWRLRIEGSGGDPALEHNGPVPGWQAVYREGLAALDAAAGGDGMFATLPGPVREVVLRTSDDAAVTRLVDVAFPHTLEFMYGAPEYGGNKDLVGWEFTNFDGDVQPRGWTDEQVENLDDPGPLGAIDLAAGVGLPAGVALADLVGLAPLGMAEVTQGMLARSGGTLSGLQDEVALTQARPALPGGITEDDVAAAVAAVARTIAGEAADA